MQSVCRTATETWSATPICNPHVSSRRSNTKNIGNREVNDRTKSSKLSFHLAATWFSFGFPYKPREKPTQQGTKLGKRPRRNPTRRKTKHTNPSSSYFFSPRRSELARVSACSRIGWDRIRGPGLNLYQLPSSFQSWVLEAIKASQLAPESRSEAEQIFFFPRRAEAQAVRVFLFRFLLTGSGR